MADIKFQSIDSPVETTIGDEVFIGDVHIELNGKACTALLSFDIKTGHLQFTLPGQTSRLDIKPALRISIERWYEHNAQGEAANATTH